MSVTALIDIVTFNYVDLNGKSFQQSLPGNAKTREISVAFQLIEGGGMYLDELNESEGDEDGEKGMKGIGSKILGKAKTVSELSRTTGLKTLGAPIETFGRVVPALEIRKPTRIRM